MAKLVIGVTNHDHYLSRPLLTGLWLSELVHFYDALKQAGHELTIISPNRGKTPIDPESLKPLFLDEMTKSYYDDAAFMQLLDTTTAFGDINPNDYDGIYLTGGHGTMFDFPENIELQRLIADFYEQDKLVSAVCHGPTGLLNVKLSTGDYLLNDKKVTGYSWVEEHLAFRHNDVPFNLEDQLTERGAKYSKNLVPMTSHVEIDANLITGQNPMSTKALADAVVEWLNNS